VNPIHDDELVDLVGRALRTVDPVPEHVLDGAMAAWTWRTIDAELAQIVFDSAAELTGVRSEVMERQLTFQVGGIEIEVMVVDGSRLVGQLVPAMATTITQANEERTISTRSDHLGRFSFDELLPHPVRLTVHRPHDGRPPIHTVWMVF